MKPLHPDLKEILLPETLIRERVKELALQISRDYAEKELHLVAVLKGALVFLADLSRALTVQTTLDFLVVSSYEAAKSSGEVRILKDLDYPIKGRHVLLVEDIIDHGITLQSLLRTLYLREPASLKVCAFLDKPSRRVNALKSDYTGFVIPNEFVVGYGLDFKESHRDLPCIATLRKEVYGGI